MKSTGMIRRIDELGRVVIPKEMRKTMNIREGEPLEIYADEDKLVLTKYSSLSNVESLAKKTVDAIYGVINQSVYVFDNTRIVAYAGMKPSIITVPDGLVNIVSDRKPMFVSNDKTLIELSGAQHQYVYPIQRNGELFGGLMISSSTYGNEILYSKLAEMGANILTSN